MEKCGVGCMKIKNIVFDVGNVLVRWEPFEVINSVFPEFEAEDFYRKIYPTWIDLNLGKLSEDEAISQCSLMMSW